MKETSHDINEALLFTLFTVDFEKKGEKETCPILDQFLSHVARTGETM